MRESHYQSTRSARRKGQGEECKFTNKQGEESFPAYLHSSPLYSLHSLALILFALSFFSLLG
jgi:hypothetical protein